MAVAASNIELKNAQTALKDATNPEEIEAASKRVVTAIENNKSAKVAEAETFDDESKRQIALLKAESEAQKAHENSCRRLPQRTARSMPKNSPRKKSRCSKRPRTRYRERSQTRSRRSYPTIPTSTQTEFDTRTAAFTAYKNKRVALADEIIANVEASEMTEAEKAAAIRKTHEDLAKDLASEWGKITAAEKAELETQKKQAETEAKAKAEAIQAQNEVILTQTEAYLIRSETAYKDSFGRSEKEQEDAFGRLLVTLTTHHAAEIKAAEDQGKDTAVLEAKHDAEIEKLQEEHLKRLQKQNDTAAKEENKQRKAALAELKSGQKDFFDAVDGATREFHSGQVSDTKEFHLDFNAAAKDGLQVFKDAWRDILADVVDLGKQYIEDMKAINEIQIEAEQTKQELFIEMSERYYEIEAEAVEKLRGLAQERVKIYEDAKVAIEKALDDHAERLVDIERNYNDRIIEINEDAVAALREIGIDSNRDRLDDTLDFHAELQSIEDAAHQKREDAAEDHEKRLVDIANQRNKDLLGASSDFVKESLKAFETFKSAVGNAGDITDIVGAQGQLNEDIGRQLQGIIRSVIGDEADSLFSLEGFDAFKFLGIQGTDLTSDNFINTLVSKLPGAIGRLREGGALGAVDFQAQGQSNTLSQLLQGTSINESTGGILGTFRDAETFEGERYLQALDKIDQWEISANEVILNTQSLIVQAGVDRGIAEGASLTQRDDETQGIAEGHNVAQADITFQEIEIKQSTRDALDQLFLDYTNRILEIDAETRAAIKAAQKQAADAFWKGVIEVGGTVLGVAAGAAISGLTGGAIPPNIAIGIGAQLGQAGGAALGEAVIGNDDAEAGFHNPIHDHLAFLEGSRSGQAVSGRAGSSQRRQFYSQQAEDFSSHFGRGFQGSYSGGSSKMSEVTVVNLEELRFLTRGFQKVLEETVIPSLESLRKVAMRIIYAIEALEKTNERLLQEIIDIMTKGGSGGGSSQHYGGGGEIGGDWGVSSGGIMDGGLLPGQPEDMTVFDYRMATRTNRKKNLLLPGNWWNIPDNDRRHQNFQQIHGKTYREHAQDVENKRAAEVGREPEVVGIQRFGGLQNLRTFHFPETDMMAYQQGEDIAELARARLMRGIRGVNYQNAQDYLKHSMQGAMGVFDAQSLFPQQQSGMTSDIDDLISAVEMSAPQSMETGQMSMALEKSIQRFDTAVDKLARMEQARAKQPQKVDVTVKQLPPSDNFLIASDDRTRQIVDQRDIN